MNSDRPRPRRWLYLAVSKSVQKEWGGGRSENSVQRQFEQLVCILLMRHVTRSPHRVDRRRSIFANQIEPSNCVREVSLSLVLDTNV